MKHLIVFLKKDGDRYHKIGQKKFELTDKVVSFKEKSFTIVTATTYIDNNTSYIFVDWDKSEFVQFIKTEMGIDAEILDDFIVKKLIAQLVSRLKTGLDSPSKSVLMTYIMCLGLGVAIGYIIAMSM